MTGKSGRGLEYIIDMFSVDCTCAEDTEYPINDIVTIAENLEKLKLSDACTTVYIIYYNRNICLLDTFGRGDEQQILSWIAPKTVQKLGGNL